ncbi:MAG: o-succinylbenzoate synthase [Bacteroidota bacterium]
MKTKDSWYIKIFDDRNVHVFGLGEVSIIENLSIDARPDLEQKIDWCCKNISTYTHWGQDELIQFPSIKFGIETAIKDLDNGGNRILFKSDFTSEGVGIPINGLIWMGDREFMRQQIIDKIEDGYKCIKIKIGALNFSDELSLLKMLRKEFSADEMELRVDANGAFKADEALEKLKRLSDYKIHSIEQPIAKNQWNSVAELCRESPIPIALDEELIGLNKEEITQMLEHISPQYIVLKPGLLGGFDICEWIISEAGKHNTAWWITSALEANIGLNAIAQWTFTLNNNMKQGLGTGQLFANNIDSPLYIEQGRLFYNKENKWDFQDIIHD